MSPADMSKSTTDKILEILDVGLQENHTHTFVGLGKNECWGSRCKGSGKPATKIDLCTDCYDWIMNGDVDDHQP
jgi:hypothetical protein